MTPFFSIVMPAFNRAGAIEVALTSVIEQSFQDYEVIVVDDGSTDDTFAVSTAFASRVAQKIQVVRQPNAGPGAARNTGIGLATGRYIALLDSDDLWFPWTLQKFYGAIKEYDQPKFVCGTPIDIQVGETANVNDSQMIAERHNDFYSVPGNPFFRFTTSGVVICKSSLDQVGGFAAERSGYEDLDLWMRLGIEDKFVLITAPPLVVRRFLGDNICKTYDYNVSGANYMISSEKTGKYPGGRQRQCDRRRLLTEFMRGASVQMARSGKMLAAFSIYLQIFRWSLAQRRLKYLLGLPCIAFRNGLKKI